VKRALFLAGGIVGLLVLVALALPFMIHIGSYKPRLEAAASDALGMDTRVGGRLSFGFFPTFHVVADGASIVGEQGSPVVTVERARLSVDLLPLVRKELRLRRIELVKPRLLVERDFDGRLNIEKLKKATASLGALDGASVSVSDGSILYVDRKSDGGFEATDLDLAVRRLRLPGHSTRERVRRASFKANVTCREIRAKRFSVTSLKGSIAATKGILDLKPATMRIFGGEAQGSLRADLSGEVPHYRLRASLPRFRIEEFLKVLSPEASAEGSMGFTATLSMAGTTGRRLVETATGDLSLRGERLTLVGTDLDEALARFRSSQNFNLVDVGAVLLAGPVGVAVTRGYGFAGLLRGSGGKSDIRVVVSDWRVERGVANAKDVAMATAKNRIALQGGLDFTNERFADVTMAVVDKAGCATVRQVIHGSFEKPEVEKPHFLKSLAGPMVKIYKGVRGLFPSDPCETFYSGSVAPQG
jgi:uncharacterized protein involved in outer membrane biogenesis